MEILDFCGFGMRKKQYEKEIGSQTNLWKRLQATGEKCSILL